MAPPLLVTIATQRSGTKFLGACLNAGAAVRAFGEALKPPPPASPFADFLPGWFAAHPTFAFRGSDIAAMLDAFLDSLAQRAADEGRTAHLDVMYNNLGAFSGIWSWPARGGDSPLCRVLRARGAGVIHLRREDLADCVASRMIAERRGYHRQEPLTATDARLRLTIDLRAAQREMEAILAARRFLRGAFRGHPALIELTYPDFIEADGLSPATIAALARLTGTDRQLTGRAALRPTAPDKASVVENWEELREVERRVRAAAG